MRPEVEEGHGAQLDIALLVQLLGIGVEAPIALDVGRVALGDLGVQLVLVVDVVEDVAVLPDQSVERIDGQQLDIVLDPAAAEREQLLQAVGIGDHRRAGVEGEALVLPDIGAAAGLLAALEDGDVEARGLQPDGQGQPAKSRADHGGLGLVLRHASCPPNTELSPMHLMAAEIGTGGLPIRIRALSHLAQARGVEALDQARRQAVETLQHLVAVLAARRRGTACGSAGAGSAAAARRSWTGPRRRRGRWRW